MQIGKQELARVNLHSLFLSNFTLSDTNSTVPIPSRISCYAPPHPDFFTLTQKVIHSSHMIFRFLALNSYDPAMGSSPETAVEDYLIYNPITRQSRKIMLYSDEKNAGTTVLGLSLAFDPSKSPYYKVVCLRTTEYSMFSYQIEVYDSKTCSWNRWGDFVVPYYTKFCNGVYWENCIHRIRPTGELFHFNLQYGTLEKRTGALLGFIRAYLAGSETFLTESNGHLHVMLLLSDAKFFSIWEMRVDKHNWFLKYSVDLNTIPAAFAVISCQAVSVLDIIRGESEKDSTLVFYVSGKIMAYRFYTKSFEVLVDLRTEEFYQPGSLQFGRYDAYQFIETLAPV